MIKIQLTNQMINSLIVIERNKTELSNTDLSVLLFNKFRKNTRKKSSFASNKIEGNPLTFAQAEEAIESNNRHFLKPEQEIRNYYMALEYLDDELNKSTPVNLNLILEVQKRIVDGEPKNKMGIRTATPPGVLFAVYDDKTGQPEYIPPEAKDVLPLLNELLEYIANSDDHPIIKAAVLHYQLVTIHPFEDGNGRTARILSNYLLAYYGYSFKSIGSLEEYFSFDIDEYYASLQMGLPILFYDGRNDPPNPEIWINYFLRIVSLYTNKVVEITKENLIDNEAISLQHLSIKARAFLQYLRKNKIYFFTPIGLSKKFIVTNRTIINWCNELSISGFLIPKIVSKRITSYSLVR